MTDDPTGRSDDDAIRQADRQDWQERHGETVWNHVANAADLTAEDQHYLAAVERDIASGNIEKARRREIAYSKAEWWFLQEIKKRIGLIPFRYNPLGAFATERARVIKLPPMSVKQALEVMSNGDCGEM